MICPNHANDFWVSNPSPETSSENEHNFGGKGGVTDSYVCAGAQQDQNQSFHIAFGAVGVEVLPATNPNNREATGRQQEDNRETAGRQQGDRGRQQGGHRETKGETKGNERETKGRQKETKGS
jgi:hypothetical protein